MDFTPERIAELRELAKTITPLPWQFYNAYSRVDDPKFTNFESLGNSNIEVIEARETELYTGIDLTIRNDDAEWLYMATNSFLDALNEIERLHTAGIVGHTEPSESNVSMEENVLTTIKKRCPRCFESALEETYVYCPRCGEVLE